MKVQNSTYFFRDRAYGSVSKPTQHEETSSFARQIEKGIREVDASLKNADKAMQEGALLGAHNIHDTMIRIEEAEIQLKFLVKVRDKALEAYQQVMRMQF